MANDSNGGGGTSVLAFILGGVLVLLGVIGFFAYTGGHFGQPQSANYHVSVNVPKHP